ncbi:MAG TPA: hypothetical protein VFG86_21050 [Chloroflexota bacterium]|nr:hypothetical protein [Chloroflexota bacterium]
MARSFASTAPAVPAVDELAALDAMAGLAGESGTVVHVVVPRGADVARRAHAAAEVAGVDVDLDVKTHSIRARFSPRSTV